MAAILDLIYSAVIGAAIFMIVLTANDIASENHAVYNGDMLVQEMLIQTVHVVEGELRNMGFGVAENERTILYADTSNIIFLTDLTRNGIPDTIRYYLGPTSELASTVNEQDRFLHRTVNGGNLGQIGVVTVLRFSYFNRIGQKLATPVPFPELSEIHTVEVTIEVQNPHAPYRRAGEVQVGERDALYSYSLWQQTRLASQNTRR